MLWLTRVYGSPTMNIINNFFWFVLPLNVVHDFILEESLPFISWHIKSHFILDNAFSDVLNTGASWRRSGQVDQFVNLNKHINQTLTNNLSFELMITSWNSKKLDIAFSLKIWKSRPRTFHSLPSLGLTQFLWRDFQTERNISLKFMIFYLQHIWSTLLVNLRLFCSHFVIKERILRL